MVLEVGIEPTLTEYKTVTLPLRYSSISGTSRGIRTLKVFQAPTDFKSVMYSSSIIEAKMVGRPGYDPGTYRLKADC